MITLNNSRTECQVSTDMVLRVEQTIDFKSSIDHRTSVGKIKAFKYAPDSDADIGSEDTHSIWMKVSEAESGEEEWISVNVWQQHYEAGIFTDNNTKTKADENTELENLEDLPF